MRIFVLGVPHTQTRTDFTTCAFTMKAWNLCRMMHRRGHEVIHLGTGGSNPDCSKNIAVVPEDLWRSLYGHPGKEYYTIDSTGKYKPLHDLFAANSRKAILELGGDPYTSILACTWGGAQQIATHDVPQFQVESGIGYRYTFAKYRVFESYAWMHMLLGNLPNNEGFKGSRWYDVVIPNAFDPDMFVPVPPEKKENYLLYIGRLNDDKGVGIAIDITKRLGIPLKIAGQGNPDRFLKGQPHVEYLGPLGVDARREVMAKARCGVVATHYIEPFGGVAVELMLSGTPVISTDWGVFPETVIHGVTGYRCRTLEQFVWAAKNIDKIDPAACREWAFNNYRLDRVALMYEEFFQQVLNLRGPGWPIEFPGRKQLDWLKKCYPVQGLKKIDMDIVHTSPEIPAPPKPTSTKTEWEQAQDWENWWWNDNVPNRLEKEVEKQDTYARLMGLPDNLDLKTTRILDLGCGPASILLRCQHGPSAGIDPLKMKPEILQKYANHGISLYNMKIEDAIVQDKVKGHTFDEVWTYNCLQHVDNLELILDFMTRIAPVVRVFEWIDLGKCPGHPHTLTEPMFLSRFPEKDWTHKIWNPGTLRGFGGTVTNKYLAFWVVKKTV